jgi:hypothetical protein
MPLRQGAARGDQRSADALALFRAEMPAAPSQGIRPSAGMTGRDAASKLAAAPQTERVALARCGAGEKPSKIFLQGTKLPISLKTRGRDETNRGTKHRFAIMARMRTYASDALWM